MTAVYAVAAMAAVTLVAWGSWHAGRHVQRLWRRHFPRIRRTVARGPRPIVTVIKTVADHAYPTWRTTGGGSNRSETGTEIRIQHTRSMRNPRYVLLGGLYLDLFLSPIKTQDLVETEYGDLEMVTARCGGSAYFVGHSLWKNFAKKSYLITRVGRNDPMSVALLRSLSEKKWIRQEHILAVKNTQCGVSVHLLQRDHSFYTTFTHKGALAELTWDPVLVTIQRRLRGGGVLYISGYFRTALHRGLIGALRDLSPNVLVCIDHGRFEAAENLEAVDVLREAFERRIVDVCTYGELCRFMECVGHHPADPSDILISLQHFAASGALPLVTVVRGDTQANQAVAFVIVGGRVETVTQRVPGDQLVTRPGLKSAFNAGLLHGLADGFPEVNLGDAVVEATTTALQCWLRSCANIDKDDK
jgi:hypothetical protein